MKQFFLFFALLLPVCAFSQLIENFDGPTIDSTNPWFGDLDDFTITDDGWLELIGDPNKKYSQIEIKTPFTLLGNVNMEWEWDVKMQFKPTDPNHIRFYLLTDDGTSADNSKTYYVQVGSNKKTITLRYLNNKGTNNQLIKQELDILSQESVAISIKVTLENKKLWSLFVREQGETDYTLIGTYESSAISTQQEIQSGIACHYSKKKRGHYIDNIRISQQAGNVELPDETAPRLLSLVEEEDNSLLLTFDKAIDADDASLFLSDEEVDEFHLLEGDVSLKGIWKNKRKKGESYTLYYSGIYAAEGSEECKDSYAFVSRLGEDEEDNMTPEEPELPDELEEIVPGDILINEVMAKPGDGPYSEYVELYNPTARSIRLDGCIFVNGNKQKILPDIVLPSHKYAVLYHQEKAFSCAEGAVLIPIAAFPALNDNGKTLQIKNSSSILIDSVTYAKAKAGISWERTDDNWHLSTHGSGGTPGAENSPEETLPDTPEEENPEEPAEPAVPEEPNLPSVKPETIAPGAILINEVMAKPADNPYPEYVELYNTTAQAINLEGSVFQNGNKEKILPQTILPSQGYAVLHHKDKEIFIERGGILIPIAAFPALNDNGKNLLLKDPFGNVIDEVNYPKAKAGISWERKGEGWYLCSDEKGGTPGAENSPEETEPDTSDKEESKDPDTPEKEDPSPAIGNSDVKPGEIIFNELLPNPFIGGSEYIELYNRSERDLDVSKLSIATRKTDGTISTHYSLASITDKITAKGYMLLSKDLEGVSAFYLISSPEVLYELKLPILANTSSTVVLFRTEDKTIIDEINYSSKWHSSSIKDQKGVALERISPERPTQEASNWTSATKASGYGTPGYSNSQQMQSEQPDTATSIHSPIFSELTGDYSIVYTLDKAGYNCRAFIFDLFGRRVAEIANHELIGAKGELHWDGNGLDGNKLMPNLYIFYIELYHQTGNIKRFKKAFIVQ